MKKKSTNYADRSYARYFGPFLAGVLCLWIGACQPAGTVTPVVTEQPCSAAFPAGATVRCGTVSVPEDHAARCRIGTGRTNPRRHSSSRS